MTEVRLAREEDAEQIRDIFLASYGEDYPYKKFYDLYYLKKMVFSDDTVVIVAEEGGRILGTASVILDTGAFADLVGEFGRLAVHPDGRHKGIGTKLMQKRLELVRDRLQVAVVEPRAIHPYSQKIAVKHGFFPVGFVPQKMLLQQRESVGLMAQYFGDALTLRRNHPRMIPEALPLAKISLENAGLRFDAIADDESPAYPVSEDFRLEDLTTRGYSSLLRFQRGRTNRREIFGPMRLHYGIFKVKSSHSNYLIAREGDQIAGGIGFTLDEFEKTARIFEIISGSDGVIRFLLTRLEQKCEELGVNFIEADLSADAPRMQRTFLELHYQPVAYVPGQVFHQVERLDAIKMVRLLTPLDVSRVDIIPELEPAFRAVVEAFRNRTVSPEVEKVLDQVALFSGLNREQRIRIGSYFTLEEFGSGECVFTEKEFGKYMYFLVEGKVEIAMQGKSLGAVGPGESLGESSLLRTGRHSATARAVELTRAVCIPFDTLGHVIRTRPDIGVVIYRNLAQGIGDKLRRLDVSLLKNLTSETSS